MTALLFVLMLAALYGGLVFLSAKHLPKERWQIAATIPLVKTGGNGWRGVNLTYYGIFTANASLFACALFVLLTGSLAIPMWQAWLFLAPLMLICMPATIFLARLIEKKTATSSVVGAIFMALTLTPWLVMAIRALLQDRLAPGFEVMPMMAAVSICYVLGEGLGRFACISFGCCYGRPMEEAPSWVRLLFSRWQFVFIGATKKVSYEGGLEGRPVVPIQAITSLVLGLIGFGGLFLFLRGAFNAALWLSCLGSALWRIYSESLRADFRGHARITAYQKMTLLAAVFASFMPFWFPAADLPEPVLAKGLTALWNPGVLLGLQALWVMILAKAGLSQVTSATIEFHVLENKI
jgi:prolipoprotein diacylglyceryltransferase